jgi:hypothetical protein
MNERSEAIYLLGVPTVDWLNVEGPQHGIFWSLGDPSVNVHLTSQPGGCLLLYSLLQQMLPDENTTLHITDDCKKLYSNFCRFDPSQLSQGAVNISLSETDHTFRGIDPFEATWRHNWTLWKSVPKVVPEDPANPGQPKARVE